MKKMIKLHIYVVLCLLSAQSVADERWYQVEVIVFSQQMPNTEVLTQNQPAIDLSGNLAHPSRLRYSLAELLRNPIAYAQVDSADRLLNGSYHKLQRSNPYHPLLHVSWIQPARANRVNRGVYLGLTDQRGVEILKGVVKIQRGHYLHLRVDMEYTPDPMMGSQGNQYSDSISYRIKEKRRFLLNDVHYLDHPRFGIIFTVKPLTEI